VAASSFVNLYLGVWLAVEYDYNQFLQAYVQQILPGGSLSLGFVLGMVLVGIALMFSIFLAVPELRVRLPSLQLVALILEFSLMVVLSVWLNIEYQANVMLRIWVSQNVRLLAFGAIGTGACGASIIELIQKGWIPARLWSLIRVRTYELLAVGLYVILTVAMTYPLVFHMGDSIMWTSADAWHTLWNMWWVKQSVTTGSNLYLSNIILYPTGVPVIFQPFSFINSIPSIPLQELFGLIITYNLFVLQSYILSGVNMFFLGKYLTGKRTPAFLAGLVFMFSPQHEAQSFSHLNLMTQQWLPIYALFLIKTVREPRMRNAIYAAVALFANAMSDLHYLWFSLVLTAVVLAYALWKERDLIWNRNSLRRLSAMLGIAGLPTIAAYWEVLKQALFSVNLSGATSIQTATKFSADLVVFVTPGPLNPLLGHLTGNVYAPIPLVSQLIYYTYAGWTVLALSAYAVWTNRKREVWFWVIPSLVFFILALGPRLHIDGNVTQIPLPYNYLYYGVPLFKDIRSPYRFDIGLMMFLAVFVAYGFQKLSSTLRGKRVLGRIPSGQLVAALLAGLILTEFFIAPVPLVDARIPGYYNILKNDPGNYAVVEIPLDPADHVFLYYQTFHGQTLVNGATSRTPLSAFIFEDSAPFFRLLHNSTGLNRTPPKDILAQNVNDTDIVPYILGQYNIRYLIVHSRILKQGGFATVAIFNSTVHVLSQEIGPPIYNDTETVMFRYQNLQQLDVAKYLASRNRSNLMQLSGDWGRLSRGQRLLGLNGTVQVYSNTANSYQVQFEARSYLESRSLDVYWNGQLVGQYMLATVNYLSITTPVLQARAGENTLSFTSPGGCAASPAYSCVSFSFKTVSLLSQA